MRSRSIFQTLPGKMNPFFYISILPQGPRSQEIQGINKTYLNIILYVRKVMSKPRKNLPFRNLEFNY